MRRETGQNPDAGGPGHAGRAVSGLDDLGRELARLARTGLVVLRLQDALRREQERFRLLLGLRLIAGPGGSQEDHLRRLIEEVVLACQSLDEPQRTWAMLLFGTTRAQRAVAYETRHMNAAAAWAETSSALKSEDKIIDSFDRRHRKPLIAAVEMALLQADLKYRQVEISERTQQGTLYQLVEGEDNRPNGGYVRLSFAAATTLDQGSRYARFTDWTYRDLALHEGRQKYFRLFTSSDSEVSIEPLSPNVRHAERLGVNSRGFQTWRIEFVDVPAVGESHEWSVRKRFGAPQGPLQTYLALSNSQPQHIQTGKFSVRFRMPKDEQPRRVARFVNPRGQLPNLRGSIADIEPERPGLYMAQFDQLVPWQTHGLHWWWP